MNPREGAEHRDGSAIGSRSGYRTLHSRRVCVVQFRDRREISGTYHAIVSIEMLETVGAECFDAFLVFEKKRGIA